MFRYSSTINPSIESYNKISRIFDSAPPYLANRLFKPEHLCKPASVSNAVDALSHYKYTIIIGMGGAILNPKAIVGFASYKARERFIFFDDLNEERINYLENTLPLKDVGFLVISKSGDTIETYCLAKRWYEASKKALSNAGRQFFFILGIKDSTLGHFAENIGASIYDHDMQISGRFATFTNVGIIPGLLAELDMLNFCEGGHEILCSYKDKNSNVLLGAATLLDMQAKGLSQSVNITYSSKLTDFIEWQAQIIAESLGKNGHGLTPLKALGPLDQHSQLQLYLDGPRDKFLTIFTRQSKTSASTLDLDVLKAAEVRALQKTLSDQKINYRTIEISDDMQSFGALMMHIMLEVAICGIALNIDPFNQPAVELLKEHLRKIL